MLPLRRRTSALDPQPGTGDDSSPGSTGTQEFPRGRYARHFAGHGGLRTRPGRDVLPTLHSPLHVVQRGGRFGRARGFGRSWFGPLFAVVWPPLVVTPLLIPPHTGGPRRKVGVFEDLPSRCPATRCSRSARRNSRSFREPGPGGDPPQVVATQRVRRDTPRAGVKSLPGNQLGGTIARPWGACMPPNTEGRDTGRTGRAIARNGLTCLGARSNRATARYELFRKISPPTLEG